MAMTEKLKYLQLDRPPVIFAPALTANRYAPGTWHVKTPVPALKSLPMLNETRLKNMDAGPSCSRGIVRAALNATTYSITVRGSVMNPGNKTPNPT